MKFEFLIRLFFGASLVFVALTGPALAQDVVEIGEIVIKVEAEEPTVVIFIPREKPDIQVTELKRPVETMLYNKPSQIKPRLADLKVAQVEKMNKMLAKDRQP